MKFIRKTLSISTLLLFFYGTAQKTDTKDYIEFNDRKNIVHGVYLGINGGYGEIDSKNTGLFGLKLAYVANRKFEVGFATKIFYSDQNLAGVSPSNNEDLIGAYAGLHVEPILFSKSIVNLSFPVFIGGGGIGYIDGDIVKDDNEDTVTVEEQETKSSDALFVLEPGVSVLFNISRFVQLEAGVTYRISSNFNVVPNGVSNINGFSVGMGVKVGVFNLGKNRYKKQIPKEKQP